MCPSVLVLDEPSSNLDPRARRQLIELLGTFDHTKIIASHDLDMALDLCERTIVISQGEVAADGPTREIFEDEASARRVPPGEAARDAGLPGVRGLRPDDLVSGCRLLG